MPNLASLSLRSLRTLLCVAAFTSPVCAAERLLTAHLDWSAPETSTCPSAESLVQAVETRLSRTVFVRGGSADVLLKVRIRPTGNQWSAQLELLDAARNTLGTRTLQSRSRDCAALNDVLPVVVALLVDASRQHVALDLPPPNDRTLEPDAKVAPSQDLARQGSAERTRLHNPPTASPNFGWTASAEGVYGLLPGAAPGAKLSGFIEPGQLNVPVEFWLGALTSSGGETALRMTLMHLGIGVCPKLWRSSVHWSLCSGASVGSLQTFGRGFEINLASKSVHVDVRTWTQLDVPIARPWFVRIELGAVFPLIRRRFVGESEPGVRSLLHRPAAVAPLLAVGVGVGFR
ncbi:MAG TPA: hypothetical protein VKP30_22160 [Polyangiaceae bacterium]|nr:hypothetical protein [Polyangiaceae bacterium]